MIVGSLFNGANLIGDLCLLLKNDHFPADMAFAVLEWKWTVNVGLKQAR